MAWLMTQGQQGGDGNLSSIIMTAVDKRQIYFFLSIWQLEEALNSTDSLCFCLLSKPEQGSLKALNAFLHLGSYSWLFSELEEK